MPWGAVIAAGGQTALSVPAVTNGGSHLVERIEEACGLYFRSVLIQDAGTVIPQHSHDHDHCTFVASGKARGWADGRPLGDKSAGEVFEIKAGAQHVFQALEPMTRLACVHDIASAESVKRKGL
jgi:hypothetical protein